MHVLYSYDDRAVVLTSENGQSLTGVTVNARVYNLDATEKWSQQAKLNLTPDTPAVAFNVPSPPDLTSTYFLKLTATAQGGKLLSDNFYWLSTKSDQLDWTATHDTVYTPQSVYADLTGLQDLPQVTLAATVASTGQSQDGFVPRSVSIHNSNKAVALMVHLRVQDRHNQEVTPTLWEDNYVSLLPGESRKLVVRTPAGVDLAKPLHVTVDGWNVTRLTVPLP